MGRPKLLLPFGASTVIGSVTSSFRAAGVERIAVVASPLDLPLQDWVRRSGLILAINPDPERGMLSSVLEGLAALGGAETLATRGERLLISPADLPAISASTILAALTLLESGSLDSGGRSGDAPAVLAWPTYRGRNGHPLAVAAEAIAEIPRLDPSIGLRQLRERFAGRIATVEVDDPGAVDDADTPEQYKALSGSADRLA